MLARTLLSMPRRLAIPIARPLSTTGLVDMEVPKTEGKGLLRLGSMKNLVANRTNSSDLKISGTNETSLTKSGASDQGLNDMMASISWPICWMNLAGLFVYTVTNNWTLLFFVSTSSVLLTLNTKKQFIAHFTIEGLATGLAAALNFIEMIGYGIRPISLSVRLFANITAGHILLALGNMALSFGLYACMYFIFILETLVCFIQAYVWRLLMTMYTA